MAEIKIHATLSKGYLVENNSRKHVWVSDEPTDVGGTDEGPKPTELLLSALASCKLITVKMYASRKEWPLEDVDIQLTILEKGDPTLIEKRIRFKGDLSEEQINRLIDISGRCPVAKMLAKSIEFKLV